MTTYRKYITIADPNNVTLSGLPFHPGQRVEVVLIARDEPSPAHLQELQTLFQTTQALPQAQTISESEIVAEIAADRAEQ